MREGIQDVRGSLNKLRPGALEQSSLQEALAKMIAEFGEVSQVEIEFNFSWGEVDLEKTTEDTIFRLIEESLTNSVRHGKAKKIVITFYQVTDYYITIQDDGIGSYQVKFQLLPDVSIGYWDDFKERFGF
ncbi:sensor histidine kinase [Ligilactobacillus apodemi]|uniref:sensor histidine kinase n=1 Tax=Ligilactobacillus apodemi TaxID=307126 RepID=UPI00214AD61F|nr:hypothetical protein [Ligilactobacillus apodemi]MCR1901516.1 hypothetical protein [Ligilactobacillus apodemi]